MVTGARFRARCGAEIRRAALLTADHVPATSPHPVLRPVAVENRGVAFAHNEGTDRATVRASPPTRVDGRQEGQPEEKEDGGRGRVVDVQGEVERRADIPRGWPGFR